MAPEEIEALARVLDLPVANVQSHLGAQWWPNRGLGPMPPTDPVIYRLYEVHATILVESLSSFWFLQGVLVYGHAIKVRSALSQLHGTFSSYFRLLFMRR